ncbi:hypothetical protein [Rothia kristinae]
MKFSYQYHFDDDEPWEDKSTTSPLSGAFMITVTPEEITVQDSHSSNGY